MNDGEKWLEAALRGLLDEIANSDIRARLCDTSILWYARIAREALAHAERSGEAGEAPEIAPDPDGGWSIRYSVGGHVRLVFIDGDEVRVMDHPLDNDERKVYKMKRYDFFPDEEALDDDAAGGGEKHKWDREGERCVKCGAKDWMDAPCHPPQHREALEAAHFQYFTNKTSFDEAIKTALRMVTTKPAAPGSPGNPNPSFEQMENDDIGRWADGYTERNNTPPQHRDALEALDELDEVEVVLQSVAGYSDQPMMAQAANIALNRCSRIRETLTTPPTVPEVVMKEAIYLLHAHALPSKCPRWEYGIGDCERDGCDFCRIQRCIDELDQALAQHSEPGRDSDEPVQRVVDQIAERLIDLGYESVSTSGADEDGEEMHPVDVLAEWIDEQIKGSEPENCVWSDNGDFWEASCDGEARGYSDIQTSMDGIDERIDAHLRGDE